jgi:hypothetical protein
MSPRITPTILLRAGKLRTWKPKTRETLQGLRRLLLAIAMLMLGLYLGWCPAAQEHKQESQASGAKLQR